MAAPVSSIRNLGPASDAAFARAGITSAEQLREMGPDAAYEALLQSGARPHFIAYYAMVMGLQGRPWNDCAGAEKATLRARFDAIKARTEGGGGDSPDAAIEAMLDRIGTGLRR
jgi:hypothetical protein